jgi:aspartyl-tRNA synthetase
MKTGFLEVLVKEMIPLNVTETLPFPLNDAKFSVNEELRYRYRYLDLRREYLQRNMKLRAEVLKYIRAYLNDHSKEIKSEDNII